MYKKTTPNYLKGSTRHGLCFTLKKLIIRKQVCFLCGPHGAIVFHQKTSTIRTNYKVVVIFGIRVFNSV